MQLTCQGCLLPVPATVFLQQELEAKAAQSSRMGRKADPGYKERSGFLQKGAISSSEIASLHLFLSTQKGFQKKK